MAMLGALASLNLMPHAEFLNLGHTQTRALGTASASHAAIFFRYGETNRYSKEHKVPISIDRIPVHIPPRVKEAKYEDYHHTALESERLELRLLELLPAQWSKAADFVACRLHIRSLDDFPTFECLSYTWGTLERNIPIFIVPNPLPEDGKVNSALPVTPQLYAALRRLRLESASRYLWIDQICIDQTNNKERGQQVQLMDRIYEQSSRTIIWIGEEDAHRETVEEMVRFINRGPRDPEENFQKLKDLLGSPSGHQKQEAVKHILNRDWFTRAWVFQEAVLSRNLLIRCGGMEVPLADFKRLTDAVMRFQYDSGGYARSLLASTVGFETLDLIHHGREGCEDEQCQILKSPPNFLQVLFEAMQIFRATNPRDLIYAFLAPRFQNFNKDNVIVPDYDKAVERVWTEAAYCIVANSRNLDILAAARGGGHTELALPSFVPDWSYCFQYARPITAPDFKSAFDACQGRLHTPIPPTPEDFFTLRVKGKIVGRVAWLAPFNFEAVYYRDGLAEFLQLDAHINTIGQHLRLTRRMSGEHIAQRWPNLEGTILRTLLADGAFGHVQPLPGSLQDIRRIISEEKTIVEMKAKLDAKIPINNPRRWQMDYELLQKVWGWALVAQRKVLFTTQGVDGIEGPDSITFGLSASAIRRDDAIVVLHGSKTPVVLRKGDDRGERWMVISQCYLDTWMYERDWRVSWSEEEADVFVLG